MDLQRQNLRVLMIRESLEGLPEFPVPAGYSIRWFEPGDEGLWTRIQAAADDYNLITPELFAWQFGSQPQVLAQRQCYLVNQVGKGIGTATAWFHEGLGGQVFGRVHWVAVLPGYQGKGLAKPLLSVVCGRLRELGHDRAYLSTSTTRVAAINLYRQFGFVPWIRSAQEAEIWRQLEACLDPLPPAGG